ncbi:hypothetical protein EDB19DRAFT_1825130 [Suillus lakei]|nr:hypothetical protein EDB19DRAFT_1825130 [Suillus lakei]
MWRGPTKAGAHSSIIVKLFNHLQLKEKATSTCCLSELKEIPSEEHFGLVKLSFASTFSGLLDIKVKESPVELDMTGPKLLKALSGDSDAADLALQSARSKILKELNIDPQLLSQSQAPFNVQPLLSCSSVMTTIPIAEVTNISKAKSHSAVIMTDTQPHPTKKCKADDIIIVFKSDSGQSRSVACKPPCKIIQHLSTTGVDAPEVAASPSNQPMATSTSTQYQLPVVTPTSTPPNSLTEMMPKQWAVATETYNNHLEEKNCANGLKTVEVAIMNHVAKNGFKSHSSSKTFWRRHCHAIELIKAEPRKKICKAHTCFHCKTIMYSGPENSGYNHRWGFCADSTKQVSKNEPPPPWPQPPGIFSKGKHFHSCTFLKMVKQIYKQVFL